MRYPFGAKNNTGGSMHPHAFRLAAAAFAAAACSSLAQQAPPPSPSFAAANLTTKGVAAMAANCSACHGTSGRAVQGSPVASLAGRSTDELVQSMAQFKDGKRPATVMHQIAKGYSEAEIAAIAAHFSKQAR